MGDPAKTQPWPADKVERWAVDRLVPAARNARTHSTAQIKQLADAIRQFGWTIPILIDPDGTIIAGHGRVMAAQSLGIAEIPVMIATDWTPEQKRAYALADNQLALNSGWDAALLKLEVSELVGVGFDMGLVGFSGDDLATMLGPPAEQHGRGAAGGGKASASGSLAAKFGLPPFSVLNAREGWWQNRKAEWIALGIQSELGRGEGGKAAPGGSLAPTVDPETGKLVRADSRGRPIPGTEAKQPLADRPAPMF